MTINAVDANGIEFKFNGAEVGGVRQYTVISGSTDDIELPATMTTTGKIFIPDVPDFGTAILNAYADITDAGQAEILAAWQAGLTAPCEVVNSDGHTTTFDAYVKSYPMIGAFASLEITDIVLKISGAIEIKQN